MNDLNPKHSEEIKSLGLKATVPRVRILELFQNSSVRHLTAEDVYRALIIENVSIGFATVYRVLTQFEHAGILLRRSFDGEKSFYELNDGLSHDHLICLDCGVVTEFSDPVILQRQETIARENNMLIAQHSTTVFAHCNKPKCPQPKKQSRQKLSMKN